MQEREKRRLEEIVGKDEEGPKRTTIILEKEVQFIEIKTNDNLTVSQLITIPEMINVAGLTVKVLQISRSKNG